MDCCSVKKNDEQPKQDEQPESTPRKVSRILIAVTLLVVLLGGLLLVIFR